MSKTAKLLSKYCGNTVPSKESTSEPITASELDDLKSLLQTNHPELYDVINDIPNENNNIAKRIIIRLLKVLSYKEHILNIVPYSSITLLEDFLEDDSIYSHEWLHKLVVLTPIIAELIQTYYESDVAKLPSYIKQLLCKMVEKANDVLVPFLGDIGVAMYLKYNL